MIGQTISHYRVIERLGSGGMGVVYRAEDTKLGRLVALKMLSDDLAADPSALERFQREARAASALNHPNICTIHEVDAIDGKPFLVMELLEGQTLRECGHLSNEVLIDLAIEFADALAAAHEAHVIHRDLKPANLFLTRSGHLKILDFGLAKRLIERDDSSRAATAMRELTRGDTTLGTAAYMSPEQARGEPLDARTDLFSFGAVLYEMATGVRAFDGATAPVIFDAILHKQPTPPTHVRHDLDPHLEPIITKALEKDRDLRYQSAADIRADLKRLKHDSSRAIAPAARPTAARVAAIFLPLIVVVVAALVFFWRAAKSRPPTNLQTTVAVLPFANMGGNRDADYLSLALPDELITILSHSRSLAVRPFAMTRKYTGDVDPQKTGRSLSVADVVTGHFRNTGGRIGITVEAIDVEKNDVLWRDSLEVPTEDLIAMRNSLSNRVRTGLLPLLHAPEQNEQNRPRNDEAYALFLHTAAMPSDPQPNKQALAALERAVKLDPSYAPAWAALSQRSYYSAEYGDGGEPAFHRAEIAADRALSIDPDLVNAANWKITMVVEKGDIETAYLQAKDLLKRRPENGDAHFTMSVALRYAGLLKESALECERALTLDPTNRGFRSCCVPFLLLGDIPRAKQYIALDSGSSWSRGAMQLTLLRKGDRAEVLRFGDAAAINDFDPTDARLWLLLRATFTHAPQHEIDKRADEAVNYFLQYRDGESIYFTSEVLAAVGKSDGALRLLRSAVEKKFCSYPAMDTDPAFDTIRNTSEFSKIRQQAIACQQRFLQFRSQVTNK
jgi:eukaryotic-like serine/threonine-protein kinase